MRYRLLLLWMLFCSVPLATAQVSIGVALPGVSIGINVPLFPELVRVPGYPVYYAPREESNFFFYDGRYWVYQSDDWYASSWYNGPWQRVAPTVVPLYLLRVPVRYYRNPPAYFSGWQPNAPPRWGQHWGNEWEQQRSGWDRRNRSAAPAPAPLPVYQRRYAGDRYPQSEEQQALHNRNYRYQPRDALLRQHAPQQQPHPAAPPRNAQHPAPQVREHVQRDTPRVNPMPPPRASAPLPPPAQPPQRGGEDAQRRDSPPAPPQQQRRPADQQHLQQPQQSAAPHERQAPRPDRDNNPHAGRTAQEPGREQGQDNGHEKGDDRGQGHKK